MGGCWEGKVSFYSKGIDAGGKTNLKVILKHTSHNKDVIAIDTNEHNHLVTASIDNVVCVWNSYNATEAK